MPKKSLNLKKPQLNLKILQSSQKILLLNRLLKKPHLRLPKKLQLKLRKLQSLVTTSRPVSIVSTEKDSINLENAERPRTSEPTVQIIISFVLTLLLHARRVRPMASSSH